MNVVPWLTAIAQQILLWWLTAARVGCILQLKRGHHATYKDGFQVPFVQSVLFDRQPDAQIKAADVFTAVTNRPCACEDLGGPRSIKHDLPSLWVRLGSPLSPPTPEEAKFSLQSLPRSPVVMVTHTLFAIYNSEINGTRSTTGSSRNHRRTCRRYR
jgi:hypothetical protein